MIFKYAMELDIIQKDYSKYPKIGKNTPIKQKFVFNDGEINVYGQYNYVEIVLIMI